jgi:aryl-alcohol dehydrogenase-like predicted oxidoreductase
MDVFSVYQIPYSVLQREHESVIGDAARAGGGIVIRGGLARGGPARERGEFWELWQQAGLDDLLGDMSRNEFILRYTLGLRDLDTTIVGTSNADHVLENVQTVLKGPLPADLMEEINRRLFG